MRYEDSDSEKRTKQPLDNRDIQALRPVKPVRLVQSVVDRLMAYILANNLQPGDLLPPQRDLADSLEVSRPILRQAVVQLENDGVVFVRQGSGMYVSRVPVARSDAAQTPEHRLTSSSDHADTAFYSHESAFAVLEARMVIESEIAALAARRATPADIEEMEQSLANIQTAIREKKATVSATSRFHRSLAKAAHSSVLARILEELAQPMMIGGLRIESALPEVMGSEEANHRTIFAAIQSGDEEMARTAMREHLEKAHQWEQRVEQLRREAMKNEPDPALAN